MRVLVFATDLPGHSEISAPFAVIAAAAGAPPPQHPGGLRWRYFATMPIEDQSLAGDRSAIESALASPGYYVSDHAGNGGPGRT